MEYELILRVCEVTDRIYDFNSYIYRLVTCKAETDEPCDTLIPIDVNVSQDDVVSVKKCKLVRIEYDNKHIITAVRIDKLEVMDKGTEISQYFNIPFLGLIKRYHGEDLTLYGPDKISFLKVGLRMRDSDKNPFTVKLLGFDDKAELLDSFDRFTIISGIATLKRCRRKKGHELVLVSAKPYKK